MTRKNRDKGKGIAHNEKSSSEAAGQPAAEKIINLGSSTHKPSASSTPFMSPRDYALTNVTIETLQGLHSAQSLSKLPDKTWAQKVEEDDLALAIKTKSQESTKAGVSSKALVVSSSQPLASKPPQTNYVQLPNRAMYVFDCEPGFSDNSPHILASKIFPPGFHFRSPHPLKTQKFYEFILVDSKSVGFRHWPNPVDEHSHGFSTMNILKVLSPADWGKDPNKFVRFSQRFEPIGYNYWDYTDAWFYALWYQNPNFSHSWLFMFKRGIQYRFPHWFNRWWNFFGPSLEILPYNVRTGLDYFSGRIILSEDPFPADLHFFSKFGLAWVMKWNFKYGKSSFPHCLPVLQRVPSVKWWAKFEGLERVSIEALKKWFSENPKFLLAEDRESCVFLNQRAKIQASLAASKNKEDFAKELKNILQLLEASEKPSTSKSGNSSPATGSSSSVDFRQENEDDCLNIFNPVRSASDPDDVVVNLGDD